MLHYVDWVVDRPRLLLLAQLPPQHYWPGSPREVVPRAIIGLRGIVMMKNRRALWLKGPVWKVAEEVVTPFGESRKELVFDRDGEPIGFRQQVPAAPEYVHDFEKTSESRRVVHHDDGSRTEVENIFGVANWAPPGVDDVCFPTRGAATAETEFTTRGTLARTVFRGGNGDDLSVVQYTCDDQGRVVRAVQYQGRVPFPTGQAGPFGTLLAPGAETCRVVFQYDSMGRVQEYTVSFGGRQRARTAYDFNEHGDIVTSRHDGEEAVRFEYEYDGWGNWTEKVAHHGGGTDQYRRLITYYAAESASQG